MNEVAAIRAILRADPLATVVDDRSEGMKVDDIYVASTLRSDRPTLSRATLNQLIRAGDLYPSYTASSGGQFVHIQPDID